MATGLRRAPSPAELWRVPSARRREPSAGRREASPAEIRRRAPSPAQSRPSLRSAGQSSLLATPPMPMRPPSRADDDDDDTNWRLKQRSAIKARHSGPPQGSPCSLSKALAGELNARHLGEDSKAKHLGELNARHVGEDSKAKVPRHVLSLSGMGCLPPLKVPLHQVPVEAPCMRAQESSEACKKTIEQDCQPSQGRRTSEDTTEAGQKALEQARAEAKAKSSACWEDLISFLEMSKLPGAYALAFSAYGVEDLSTLLSLEDDALGRLLDKCNIDAMDEILLLEALREARVR